MLLVSWLIGKDSDAGRDWGQEEKGTIEDEMAEWHHWLDGRESEWTQGAGDGQRGLVCCDSWGRKESDMTEQLNWTELNWYPMWTWEKCIFWYWIKQSIDIVISSWLMVLLSSTMYLLIFYPLDLSIFEKGIGYPTRTVESFIFPHGSISLCIT